MRCGQALEWLQLHRRMRACRGITTEGEQEKENNYFITQSYAMFSNSALQPQGKTPRRLTDLRGRAERRKQSLSERPAAFTVQHGQCESGGDREAATGQPCASSRCRELSVRLSHGGEAGAGPETRPAPPPRRAARAPVLGTRPSPVLTRRPSTLMGSRQRRRTVSSAGSTSRLGSFRAGRC